MDDLTTAPAFKDAAEPSEKLDLPPAILAWFKKRGDFWQQEIEGVLEFYIDNAENAASVPDAFEPGEMDPEPPGPA